MELTSQKMRKLAPELDPLRIGCGWSKEDLSKPQIIIESTAGDSHPGSAHLNRLVEAVRKGVAEAGGHGARYFCTDICDGESQGTDGINFSLASREMIANMIEIHANATPFDGGVYISSCDKGMPGNMIGMARVGIPSIMVTGGTMSAGPELLTLEQLGMYSAKYERGEIDEARLDWAKSNACPSCGACSFIGTASTMQILAEAMGLSLPGSALLPATSPDLTDYAYRAGKRVVEMVLEGMQLSDIVTMDSIENAILVHAAISGSTNAVMHLPAITREYGIEIDGDTFDRLHRGAHYLLDIRPAGKWPAEFFYYAGGVPAIMEEIKQHLHLDAMTVTGKTLGENLEDLKKNGFYEKCQQWLDKANEKYGLSITKEDIIRPYDKAIGTDGSIA
ncbi:MAG: dihydroxy-acid dehydratase, partial [Lachnospiraceae bacterium]|nr:dihydroxy-acid dehydratase [Lachnospiraceae bacterium]